MQTLKTWNSFSGPKSYRASAPTPWYKPCKYVPQRIRFLLRFGVKTGVDFANFALESSMVFEVGMNVSSASVLKE